MCSAKECYLVEVGYWIDKKRNIFTRNKVIPYKLKESIIRERNNIGVFNTAYRYNTDVFNSSYLFGDMYFDFDSKDFEKAREDAIDTLSYIKDTYSIKETEVRIYFSGNKGIHIVIPNEIMDIKPSKDLNKIFKSIAKKAKENTSNNTLDLVIYDSRRLFRIPRSIHESTNLYKIPITFNELKTLEHEKIKELAKEKRILRGKKAKLNDKAKKVFLTDIDMSKEELNIRPKVKKKDYKFKYIPPCINHILINGVCEGNRNNTAAALTSFYKVYGLDEYTTEGLILNWNFERNSPPLSEFEIVKTVNNIFNRSIEYGCSSFSMLSECSIEECTIYKNKLKNKGDAKK